MSNQRLLEIKSVLEESIYNLFGVDEVFTYQDKVACIRYKTEYLHVILEISLTEEIKFIFRRLDSMKKFSNFFGINFSDVYIVPDKLYKRERVIFKKFSNLAENIKSLLLIFQEIELDISCNLSSLDNSSNMTYKELCLHSENLVFQDMANSKVFSGQLNLVGTLQLIKNKELSVARFGDGEIKLMITQNGCGFQRHDWRLMSELMTISSMQYESLLVCYPSFLLYNSFWREFWKNQWFRLKPYLKLSSIGDAMISRPEAFKLHGDIIVNLWLEIFDNKNVCFVTGKDSRFDVEHFLFSKIKNSSVIYSMNHNAYSDIDSVVEQCLQKKNIDIFLIALGPTGTALSYRLMLKGRRALDIGHVTNSYDHVFLAKDVPEKITYTKN